MYTFKKTVSLYALLQQLNQLTDFCEICYIDVMTYEATPPCTFKFTTTFNNNVKWCLKAGIVELEQTSIARQQLGKHIPTETNT
jgi:hypothetical protein